MDTGPLIRAWTDWDRWCRRASKKKYKFSGEEGKAESARLVSELIRVADELGTSHLALRDHIVVEVASGKSIPDAIETAIVGLTR